MSAVARVLAVGLCCIAVQALASPQSEALVRRGLAQLEAQRYRDAIHWFGEAVKADPKDLHAVFLQGVALNRLGNYREAYLLIRGVENQGAKHPEMDFEAGWALMGMGRARACVERLERFESATPGRGQTSEFLGRCYLRLGERERAEEHFRQAVERDPRLRAGVDFRLGRITDAAASNTPTGRALRNILGLPEPVFQPDKPLQLGASLSIGRNSNVIGLGNTIPLPGDISRKDASFWRGSFGAQYTRALPAGTSATLGYALLVDRYDGIAEANVNDHFLYADLFRVFRERVGASLRVSHEYTELGGERFRDQSALRPALSYRFGEHSVSEAALSYAAADYHFASAPAFDRDGHAKDLSLTHQFRVPRSPWGGSLGFTHTRNRAAGSDFAFDADALSASARYDYSARIAASLGVTAARYDFANPNSLAGSGFSFARRDDQLVLSFQLSGPLAPQLRWFAQAQRLENDSNIAFFEFKQSIVSAGINASF